MRVKFGIASLLMAPVAIAPAIFVLHAPLAAQSADDDGDDADDEDDADAADGDDDVADPDQQDPAEDDPGGSDEAGGGDEDVGGGAEPGGDEEPTGGEEDSGDDDAGGGDDDDGAADGGSDDDGAVPGGGDDDDGAVPGGGDDDDSAAPGGGDDDDGAAAGGGDDDDGSGNDESSADDGTNDEGGDSGDDGSSQWEFADVEADAVRAELDERDRIDTDREGFRYRRGEFIALDLTAADLAQLRGKGFEEIESERLGSLSGTIHLLRGPPQQSDESALDAIEAVADPDGFGLNHLFDSSAVRTTKPRGGAVPQRTACGCDIGLIDTGVAGGLGYFKHVALVQRAFSGKVAQPRLHGTAVAHLMAGTKRSEARATRIFVADIFSGPRETSGSSFALIKALDWLAAQGVPVINISLSGPRNPVVASAVARINKRGHVIVAAAGNDGPAAPPVFPGAYEGVVGVTAVDGSNRVYRYANRGTYVDFSARGVAVPAIDAEGGVRDATGTSFAAPVIAARLAAQLRQPDPAASQRAIRGLKAQARDLGAPGRDPIFGVGLIEEPK